jgi:hypothetical protein
MDYKITSDKAKRGTIKVSDQMYFSDEFSILFKLFRPVVITRDHFDDSWILLGYCSQFDLLKDEIAYPPNYSFAFVDEQIKFTRV